MPDDIKESLLDQINSEYLHWFEDDARHQTIDEVADWFFSRIEQLIETLTVKP